MARTTLRLVQTLLVVAVVGFFALQFWLFSTETGYADKLSELLKSERSLAHELRHLRQNVSTLLVERTDLEDTVRGLQESLMQAEKQVGLARKLGMKGDAAVDQSKASAAEDEEEESEDVAIVEPVERLKPEEVVAAVVIVACNRADYLERTIKSVLQYYEDVARKYHLFISQDGTHEGVKKTATTYSSFTHLQHIEEKPPVPERPGDMLAYYRISNHYKFVLEELFDKRTYERVIILEDDMEISEDFFDYFEAAAALLDVDESLMAVSSWNDNGQKQFIRLLSWTGLDAAAFSLVRTEAQLRTYWDDWLRLHTNRKGRQSLRPEICRTYNFGEHGSSMGQYFDQYLRPIKLNDVKVDWKSKDLSYLLGEEYPKNLSKQVADARLVEDVEAIVGMDELKEDVRIVYKPNTEAAFKVLAAKFGVFQDWKDNVPRTAYKGVVSFRYKGPHNVFLLSPHSLKDLGIS
eukprot:SM000044S16027  [mRNA]  locus=s44:605471:610565:+ [translate_table: standard]